MSLIKHSEITSYLIRFKRFNLKLSSLSYKKGEDVDSITSFKLKGAGLLSINEEDEVDDWMHSEIKEQVKLFIQSKYYTVRLFAAAAVFLVVYLFCSLVIRDPIPMIDEFLLGILGAIAIWIFLERREGDGAVAHKLNLDLKELYAKRDYEESDAVEQIEAYVYDLESEYDPISLATLLANGGKEALPTLTLRDKKGEKEIKELLSLYLDKEHVLAVLRKKVLKSNKRVNKPLSALIYSAHQNGNDVYLLALCIALL